MLRHFLPLFLFLNIGVVASPLTVYAQANREGAGTIISEIFTIYRGLEIPDGLDNKISSFKLDAGYMAVVADSPEGFGPGKVYIADGQDLFVNFLPAELENALSFIRVIPWKTSLKKGTGGDLSDQPSVDAAWYYRWGYDLPMGQVVDNREYVPMSWGAGGTYDDDITAYLSMNQVTHLLGFNEPDSRYDQSGQYQGFWDVENAQAVNFYRNLQKAGLRLGSPAPREEGARGSSSWLAQFIDQCEAIDIRIDFVALHWYDWGSSPKNNTNPPAENVFRRFKSYLSNAYHEYRRPLWITEFNANLNRGTNVQNAFMELALPYLESIGYVERYAWFQPSSDTGDFFADGQLTSTGQIYKDQISTMAYASETLPSSWNNQDIGIVALPGTTIQANGNFTVCGAGNGIGATADSFHYLYQTISGEGTIETYVESILERGNSKAGLMIRETLDADSRHASIFLTEAGNAVFEYRSSTGETTQTVTQAGIQAPYWLKMKRQGDLLTGYYSEDRQTWNAISEQSIAMDAGAYQGLAVSSQDSSAFCDTIFKQVAVGSGSDSDSDNDLLQDSWELSFFGDLTTADGGNTNNDLDQNTDLEEFIFGTVPTDPKSFFTPATSATEEGYLEIAFEAIAGRTYSLEISESLAPESWISVKSVSPDADGLQTLDYAHQQPPVRLFGRIRAKR